MFAAYYTTIRRDAPSSIFVALGDVGEGANDVHLSFAKGSRAAAQSSSHASNVSAASLGRRISSIARLAASASIARAASSFASLTGAHGSGSCPSGPGGSVPTRRCARSDANNASIDTDRPSSPRAAAVAASTAASAAGVELSTGAEGRAGYGAADGCDTWHRHVTGERDVADASSSAKKSESSSASKSTSRVSPSRSPSRASSASLDASGSLASGSLNETPAHRALHFSSQFFRGVFVDVERAEAGEPVSAQNRAPREEHPGTPHPVLIPRLERVTLHAQLQRAPIVRVSLRRETVQSKRSIVIRAVAVGDGELFARDDVSDASRLGETNASTSPFDIPPPFDVPFEASKSPSESRSNANAQFASRPAWFNRSTAGRRA